MREAGHVELGGFGRGLLLDSTLIEIGPLRPPRNPPFWHAPKEARPKSLAQVMLRSEKGRDLTLGLVV